MKQSITLNVKADLSVLKERLARVQKIEKELDEVMKAFVQAVDEVMKEFTPAVDEAMKEFTQAVMALNNTRVPFRLDPADESEPEEESEEKDRFSISPYDYPEEFPTENDIDPFDFGTDKDNTPFATVDDYEGLG